MAAARVVAFAARTLRFALFIAETNVHTEWMQTAAAACHQRRHIRQQQQQQQQLPQPQQQQQQHQEILQQQQQQAAMDDAADARFAHELDEAARDGWTSSAVGVVQSCCALLAGLSAIADDNGAAAKEMLRIFSRVSPTAAAASAQSQHSQMFQAR